MAVYRFRRDHLQIKKEQCTAAGTRDAIQEQLRMGQELRRKVEAPGSGSEDNSDTDSATDASGDEADEAAADLSKPSKKAIAKAKAAAMDIMQSESPVLVDYPWRLGIVLHLLWPLRLVQMLRPARIQIAATPSALQLCHACMQCALKVSSALAFLISEDRSHLPAGMDSTISKWMLAES